MASTRAGLTRLLHAVRDLREFHLVEFLPGTGRIALTAPGSDAATAVRGNDIRSAAARLLGPSPAEAQSSAEPQPPGGTLA